jgi:cell fate regulator YaaT (PSP1 superfamily)
MLIVIGVRFKKAGKIYYFDPDGQDVKTGDAVIVETVRGVEHGDVVVGPKEVPEEEIIAPLKKVIRVATDEDKIKVEENRQKEKEAYGICYQKIQDHNLAMKLVDVEFTFDNNKIIFYFTADGRIDFRELVKDLASIFKTRIELRQIGVRDEAKMMGGLGPCGRSLCCGTFLGEFQPVSIKMAKEQSLSLNPTKISGICGRLMCCLKYEQDYYEEARKKMPKLHKEIMTPDGRGVVVENNVIQQKVKAKITLADGTIDIKEYGLNDIQRLNGNHHDNGNYDDSDQDEDIEFLIDD